MTKRECMWCHEHRSSAVAQWVNAPEHPEIDGGHMWVCDECHDDVREWVLSQ